jgi:hypothetical protein
MSIDQFGNIAGAYVEVDGKRFDGVTFLGATEAAYKGPEQFVAISGRPYLQGPASWTVKFDVSNADTYQTLYTIWNIKLNGPAGPRVTFGLHDPRNAMAFQEYDCWMSEPPYTLRELFIRDVVFTFTTAVPA